MKCPHTCMFHAIRHKSSINSHDFADVDSTLAVGSLVGNQHKFHIVSAVHFSVGDLAHVEEELLAITDVVIEEAILQ